MKKSLTKRFNKWTILLICSRLHWCNACSIQELFTALQAKEEECVAGSIFVRIYVTTRWVSRKILGTFNSKNDELIDIHSSNFTSIFFLEKGFEAEKYMNGGGGRLTVIGRCWFHAWSLSFNQLKVKQHYFELVYKYGLSTEGGVEENRRKFTFH